MASRIVIEREFATPPDRVFAYLCEHENLEALFGARVRRLRDGDDSRNGVGSERELRVGPLPAFVETVTEVVPGELVRYRITKGSPLKDHYGEMRFSPSGEGTHLRYEIGFAGRLPGIDKIVKPGLERNIRKGLERVDREA